LARGLPKDLLNPVRGMRDIMPEEMAIRNTVLDAVRDLFSLYCYKEVLTPTIEPYELYEARSGEEIKHRMYAFTDLGGRKVVLRPEATATISRLVVRKFRSEGLPIRLGYVLSAYRYDEPQRARYREFLQAGFELFGSRNAEADAEILRISDDLMRRLGFEDYFLKVGHQGLMKAVLSSGGIPESSHGVILGYLDKGQLEEAKAEITKLAGQETATKAEQLVLLSKEAGQDHLVELGSGIVKSVPGAEEALADLSAVIDLCKGIGLDKIKVDLGFVRGLEYYTGTIFEVRIPGFPVSVVGGGRYDGLTGLFGYTLPAVGCAPGVDRLVVALQERSSGSVKPPLCMVVATSPECLQAAFKVADALRSSGAPAVLEVNRRNLGSALRFASERGIRFVAIIGAREVKDNFVTLKDLSKNVQVKMSLTELPGSVLPGKA
jgi:histidyl-tRNA synthetase